VYAAYYIKYAICLLIHILFGYESKPVYYYYCITPVYRWKYNLLSLLDKLHYQCGTTFCDHTNEPERFGIHFIIIIYV